MLQQLGRMLKSAFGLILGCSMMLFGSNISAESTKNDCQPSREIVVHCGKTPSSTFGSDGNLWVVFEHQQHLYVSFSPDLGKSYSAARKVNSVPESIYTNGENRPKIAFGKNQEIYLSWTQKTEGRFTGDIRFSRSLDGGKIFSKPVTVNDDGILTSHRFESMKVANDGTIFLAWIDKRDNFDINAKGIATKKKAKNLHGGIYTSFSTDSGKTFSKNQKLALSSCVCCRLAMTPVANNGMAVSWRHVYPGSMRDHAYAIINTDGIQLPATRVSLDNWEIQACPHHGPSIAKDYQQKLHLVWFTASETRKGIFYGRLNSSAEEADNLINLSAAPSASHPFISIQDNMLVVIWKEFDGEKTKIIKAQSNNLGNSWNERQVIAETAGKSGHPFIANRNNKLWLSWLTKDEGFRVEPIGLNHES